MKEKSNNEIDLLLRRLSRHDSGSVRDGEARDHLDVDELSSYALNALPAAARARYTQHLAECTTCRKLVTELSLSLGATAAAAAPVETVAVTGGLRKFLASLFSPMVLRYAVPALGLIVAAVIGFVALRQPARESSVALRANQERVPITASPDASPVPIPNESQSFGLREPKKETANTSPVERPKESAPKGGIVADGVDSPAPVTAAAPVARDDKRPPEPQPSAAAEPPAQQPAKTVATADTAEQKKLDTVAKKEETVRVETKESEISTAANEPARGFMRERRPATKQAEENKAKDAPATAGSSGSARLMSAGRADNEKRDADTRTVAGRRFRKERGIWTDTAYDSGTATVNMARGSDQYKALVADEPEIKKIAEQLDGEVIVVWKGRAYRIR